MKRLISMVILASGAICAPAHAAPGLAAEVYGARVEQDTLEIEARYGELNGGADDGEAGLVLEASRGFKRFYGAVLGEFGRAPGGDLDLEAISVEGLAHLGRIPGLGVDVGVYGEYEATVNGTADAVELKALLQKTAGPLDTRLNLIVEQSFGDNARTEYGYAAAASLGGGDARIGVQAFGDLGDDDGFGGRREHFIGPVGWFELEHLPAAGELEFELGYLFAAGAARDDADGQFRLLMAWEKHF